MAEELLGTNIEKGKGEDEFFEVEKLIKETLDESKQVNKEMREAAAPAAEPAVKSDFKGTHITVVKKEQKPAPAEQKAAAPSPEAEKYEATFREYKVGDVVKGKVVKIDPSGVLVDIKYKSDGLLPLAELSDRAITSADEVVKIGQIIDVYIENLESKEGYVLLSKKRADYDRRWDLAYDAYKSRKMLEGKVTQVVQGGLVVDCDGIRGFVPASQVLKKMEEPLASFKDKTIPVKIIEINRRQGKIVLSHKMASGEKEKVQSSKIIEELEVGQVRHGKVTSLKSFGAFVDLGGIEGLVHLSELSWKRVKHPSELLKTGQELDVFVLGVDKTSKKVALGLKELQPDPWVNAASYYKPGQIIKVKVLRFAKFGAFVELDHGLEGLIHISELSKEPVSKPDDAVKIDDVVEVKVLRVQPEEQRIGLSVKGAIAQKEKAAAKEAVAAAASSTAEEQKVTIGHIIAEKEKAKAEREAEEVEETEES